MKKLLSVAQTREADQYTIHNEPITSLELMERASLAFVSEFEERVSTESLVIVVCGTGNNGGDGLAIARLLKSKHYNVRVILVRFSSELSDDCLANLKQFGSDVNEVKPSEFVLPNSHVVVDALFGSGLNRPILGDLERVVSTINNAESKTFSVDVPSGLFSDEVNLTGAIVQADFTITFQRPKLSFFIPESGSFVGEWKAVNIGLDEDFIEAQNGSYFLLDHSIRKALPPRAKFQHKGHFGRVQVFAGSYGKMGAAFLCSKAAMKSGAGLLTAHVPKCGVQVLQTSLPEAMVSVDSEEQLISEGSLQKNTDVVCFGPGVGVEQKTVQAFRQLLEAGVSRLVVDADGLNILSEHSGLLDLLPESTVLTPHVGEFHRLFGKCSDGLERIKVAQSVAKKKKLVIILKGAHSAIIVPSGEVYFNNTGNAGMATAGSGDVLAGIVTGLMAQGLGSEEAACLGVFLHGLAGDLARKNVGEVSLMASDLLHFLPKAISNA